MYKPLVIIVPTRSRPHNVPKVLNTWKETGAFRHADLIFAYDDDDPNLDLYRNAVLGSDAHGYTMQRWMPLVPKLNHVAMIQAGLQWREAIGFAGDDHLPRSDGWAQKYLEQLRKMGAGIVYGNDLHQGQNLCTEWAMTKNIVNALGKMVPADVDHLYSDSSVLELGNATGTIQYMPDVVIEHVHPMWKKAKWDQQYQDVNSKQQYRKDGIRFNKWRAGERDLQAAIIEKLREEG